MDEFPHGIAMAWSFPVVPAIALVLTELIYLRGWKALQKTRRQEMPPWRAQCFTLGLLSLWIAFASPIDALDDLLLSAHMIQHFILMSVAPPLIVLGAPTVPLLRGLPRVVIRFFRPLFASRGLHGLSRFLTHPVTAWLAMNIAYLGWHVPAAYELTLRSEAWHNTEHLIFLFTSIAFWWVVLAPWPARPRWQRWTVIPYLLSADLINTILSATLAFSGRVIYPRYAAAERVTSLTPMNDQVLAGAEMWVMNSMVFLVPAMFTVISLLSSKRVRRAAYIRPAVRHSSPLGRH